MLRTLSRVILRYRGSGDRERQGVNPLFRLGAFLLVLAGSRRLPKRLGETITIYRRASRDFQESLIDIQRQGEALSLQELLKLGLLKAKYYFYAPYLALFSTLPTIPTLPSSDMVRAIITKSTMAVSTKVMDNINDGYHAPADATRAVVRLEFSLLDGWYSPGHRRTAPSWLPEAENAVLKMACLVGRPLKAFEGCAPFSYGLYRKDVTRLIRGQLVSLIGTESSSKDLTIIDYLGKVTERSTGSLWTDIDLCFLEGYLGGLDSEQRKHALSARACSDLLIKSCLLYDDVVDFLDDIRDGAVNSVLILALERGVLTKGTMTRMDPLSLLKLVYRSGMAKLAIAIGDTIFLKSVRALQEIPPERSIIDPKGLEFHCRVLRLFNLRKMVLRDKSPYSLGVWLESLGSLERMRLDIPDELISLEKYVYAPD